MESSVGEEFALHADMCNLGSGFLATDYMSFLQSSGYSRPNHETKQAKSNMNTVPQGGHFNETA